MGPNMFQSVLDEGDLSKDEIVAARARTSIAADKRDIGSVTSLYAVDFDACMKAFLSRRALATFPFDSRDQAEIVTTTLSRFMDYLLQRDVCPEYVEQVLAARSVCRGATDELWCCAQVLRHLPSDFNIACSTLFGGQYSKYYDGVSSWDEGHNLDNSKNFVGFTKELARQIANFGVAAAAPEEVFQAFVSQHVTVRKINAEHEGFEVTAIELVTDATKEFYSTQQSLNFKPVGVVYAKPWANPDAPQEDLNEEERRLREARLQDRKNSPDREPETEYPFLVDEPAISFLRTGMKVEAAVYQLVGVVAGSERDLPLCVFDTVLRVFPSFDTYIEEMELMIGYKPPRPVEGREPVIAEEGPAMADAGASWNAAAGDSDDDHDEDDDHLDVKAES